MTTQIPLLNIADYETRARETMPKPESTEGMTLQQQNG